jgi:hypothetical protein
MSGPTKFNFNNYINEFDSKEMQSDVFDELNYLRIELTEQRRFSFSIPEEVEKTILNENYFPRPDSPPPTPPSSPSIQPISTPRASIKIPEDDDLYLDRSDFIPDKDSVTDSSPSYLTDIQTILDYPKELLLTSNKYDKCLYKRPSKKSSDARKIWRQAHIPRHAYVQDIEYLLLDWAFTYAHLKIENKKIEYIYWRSGSNCHCQATWTAFLHWILCSSISFQT